MSFAEPFTLKSHPYSAFNLLNEVKGMSNTTSYEVCQTEAKYLIAAKLICNKDTVYLRDHIYTVSSPLNETLAATKVLMLLALISVFVETLQNP